MPMRRWILVVEPNETFRDIVVEEATVSKADHVDIVSVSYANELLIELNHHDLLPDLLIVEWFASGNQVRLCLEGLQKHAVLHRLCVIATSGASARQALVEAQDLGIRRFVCKQPDEYSFRKKIAEAINEFLPSESRAQSHSAPAIYLTNQPSPRTAAR